MSMQFAHACSEDAVLRSLASSPAGLSRAEIKHQEVMEVGERAGRTLSSLIIQLIPRLLALDAEVA